MSNPKQHALDFVLLPQEPPEAEGKQTPVDLLDSRVVVGQAEDCPNHLAVDLGR